MPGGGDEFRERAARCRALAARLKEPEHRAFAIDLANAWLVLAEWVERKLAVTDETILIVAQSDGFASRLSRGYVKTKEGRHDPADLAIDDAGVDVGRTLGVGG